MALKNNGEWVQTDPDINQYGRQLSPTKFEFKQDKMTQRVIDLTLFSLKLREETIVSFGYTQGETTRDATNIFDQYGVSAYWIIAECIFECEIKEDLLEDHGILENAIYEHAHYGQVTVKKVMVNTGDKQNRIAFSVIFLSHKDGQEVTQGINGFKHDSTLFRQ